MKHYKFLDEDNRGEYSGFDFTEYLPKNGKPGKWLPKVAAIELCVSGYHACKKEHVIEWMNAQMFEVELRGDIFEGDEKDVSQQMRFVKKINKWNDKNAALAACDIAEIVVPIWNKHYPDDKRPQNAIDTARRFARGKATKEELAAAWAAAWAAARAAARDAAKKILYKYMGI